MPLTFITGFYGMNLSHLPLQDSLHSVGFVIGLMLASTAVILLYFRRKGWM